MTTELELGKRYTDRYSGVSGVALELWAHQNGCFQVSLQPPLDETGKRRAYEYTFDTYLDDEAGDGVERPQRMADRAAEILGKQFRDTISGLEGTAVSVRFILNGTEQISLQPRGKPNELPKSWSMDAGKLEEILPARRVRTPATVGGADMQAPRI